MKSAAVGEAERLPVEASGGIIESGFLGVPPRQKRVETARDLERPLAIEELKVFPVPGHRDIGQMPVQRERREHFHAIDGRALAFVDRGGVAEIEIAVEALLDLDPALVFPFTGLGDDPAGAGFDHPADHAVLDAERALVPEKHDLVASVEMPCPLFRLKRMTHADNAALDQLFAREPVEFTHVATQMGQDDCGLLGIVFAVPGCNQALDRLGLQLLPDHPAAAPIGRERGRHIAARQIERGGAHPGVFLAVDRLELGIAGALDDGAEGSPRLDRLELLGIADKHQLGAGLRDRLDECRHLFRRDHAGLVHNEDRLVVEAVAPLVPAQLPGRQGAGRDSCFRLEALGSLAGQRAPDHRVACRLPCLAHRAHHRRLAGAGAADNGGNPRAGGHVPDGRALLVRKTVVTREHVGNDLLPDLEPLRLHERGCPGHHLRFEADQLARGEPVRQARAGRKVDRPGFETKAIRALKNPRQELLEGAGIVDISMQHLGDVALIEHALFARDEIEDDLRPGLNALGVHRARSRMRCETFEPGVPALTHCPALYRLCARADMGCGHEVDAALRIGSSIDSYLEAA